MAVIKKSAIVSYKPSEMYDLVDRIEAYPEFLPGCRAATVHLRTRDEVRATIYLSKGGIQHSFSTINRLQPNKMIEVRLLEGPFRHLEGFWRFDEVSEGCQIFFDLEFILANRFLDKMVSPVLQTIGNSFVDAFCKRAKVVYG